MPVNIGASLFHPVGDRSTIYAIPSLCYSAERGASLGDYRTVGLLAGASYRFSDTLTIGPGFGAFSEIEDDTGFFPLLIVNGQISDRLSPETGQGFAATRGPGLELRWKQSPSWDFAFGGRYEKARFRLDDKGPASGGVGEDKSLAFYAVANYRASNSLALSMIGGVDVGATLALEGASGTEIGKSDADHAGLFGATFKLNL
jgi:outer membrane receptor protein involved in Fe transport